MLIIWKKISNNWRLILVLVATTVLLVAMGTAGIALASQDSAETSYPIGVDQRGNMRLLQPDNNGNYGSTLKANESMIEVPSMQLVAELQENIFSNIKSEVSKLEALISSQSENIRNQEARIVELEDTVSILENMVSMLESKSGNPDNPDDAGGMVTDGLVLWLAMDEGSGTVVTDESDNGNNGAINGATWRPEGLYFDGIDDYLDFTPSTSFDITGDMTHSAWINTGNSRGSISTKWLTLGGQRSYGFTILSGRLRFWFSDDGADYEYQNYSSVINASVINDNQWHHIAAVYNAASDTVIFYVDGAEDIRTVFTQETGPPFVSSANFRIGDEQTGNIGQYYSGLMGDYCLYAKALTPEEIAQNYVATKATYE